jgi:hypothetical protein
MLAATGSNALRAAKIEDKNTLRASILKQMLVNSL